MEFAANFPLVSRAVNILALSPCFVSSTFRSSIADLSEALKIPVFTQNKNRLKFFYEHTGHRGGGQAAVRIGEGFPKTARFLESPNSYGQKRATAMISSTVPYQKIYLTGPSHSDPARTVLGTVPEDGSDRTRY